MNGKEKMMIVIEKSKTADTRSCDFSKVSEDQLRMSSYQHIENVERGIKYFISMMEKASILHDYDKLTEIAWFHHDFITGFKETGWWDNHRKVSRHHLLQEDGVPENVNLVDVIEMVVDCVMAGMGRTGEVYPLKIDPEVLMKAFNNTVELLKSQVIVKE
jgi:hypothetical protein